MVDDIVTERREPIFEYCVELIDVPVAVKEQVDAFNEFKNISEGEDIIGPIQYTQLKAALFANEYDPMMKDTNT